jgi:hypothetical protein
MTGPTVLGTWQRRITSALVQDDDGTVWLCTLDGMLSDCECTQGQNEELCGHVAALVAEVAGRT